MKQQFTRSALQFGLAFCIAFLSLGVSSVVASAADYYALIIGVADYPGVNNDLRYTDDDAIAVYDKLLGDSHRWVAGRMTLLLNSDASKGAIYHALATIAAQGSAEDVLLLYFSGHGTTGPDVGQLDEIDGYDEYICCYGDYLAEFIRDDELSDWLAAVPMERIVVMLDTCYSGGQIKGIPGDMLVKSLSEEFVPSRGDGFAVDLVSLDTKAIGPQDLDDLEKSVVVITSSDEDEYSWEFGAPLYHGLFTYYLLEALDGAADEEGNFDGDINAREAYEYLCPLVVSMSDTYHLNEHPQFHGLGDQSVIINSWDKPGDCDVVDTTLYLAGWHLMGLFVTMQIFVRYCLTILIHYMYLPTTKLLMGM